MWRPLFTDGFLLSGFLVIRVYYQKDHEYMCWTFRLDALLRNQIAPHGRTQKLCVVGVDLVKLKLS